MGNKLATVKQKLNTPLWWIGWNGKATILGGTIAGAFLGNAIDAPIVVGTLCFMFIMPAVWIAGVFYVNQNYESVLNAFKGTADEEAMNYLALEDEKDIISTHSILSGSGSKILRKPAINYNQVTMVVTDYSLIIHDDAKLNTPSVSSNIGKSTEEIYYDSVASVNYEDGEFWVNRTDGRGHSWPSEREPDDALDDIQQRVREYKRSSAPT